MDLTYKPSISALKFLKLRNFVDAIMGPVGSGKSVSCVIKLLMFAYTQAPDKDNIRRTKWAVIRNTYRELLDTTMATFFTWVDKESGHYSALNMTFVLKQPLPDGTVVEAEFLFRALDKPDDAKKLLSLEITGAWINEAREIPKAIFDLLQTRVGRYPSKFLHAAPTWFGVILDTNPPDSDHWWYTTFEEMHPDGYNLIKQPSGRSKSAENIANLPDNYYTTLMQGKDEAWIKVYVDGEYGFVLDGKPIYPEYKDHIHCIDSYIPNPKLPLHIGLDFGLTPAAAFAQYTPTGSLIYFDELVTFDMGAVSFGELLKEKLATKYRAWKDNIEIAGDPAGDIRSQTDENTPYLVLSNLGLNAYPTYTNDYTIRRETMAILMRRLNFAGEPAFSVTPGAPTLRKALCGGYKYKRMQVAGDERYQDKPDKSKYSHIAEAAQYCALNAVGGDIVVGGFKNDKIDYSAIDRSIT